MFVTVEKDVHILLRILTQALEVTCLLRSWLAFKSSK